MSKKTMLLVHEDPCVSNFLLQFVLTPKLNYRVATNYLEVTKAMNDIDFDLIITDLTINGNFTYRYLEYLRVEAPLASIVVISEMDNVINKQTIKKMGANDFVQLPLDIWKFTKKIDTLLCA